MTDINAIIVLTTVDNKKEANFLAEELVKNGLAACVQIEKIESVYNYNEKICKALEWRLMIKSVEKNYKNIEKFITVNHKYELPQIIKLDIKGGSLEFLTWLNQKSMYSID